MSYWFAGRRWSSCSACSCWCAAGVPPFGGHGAEYFVRAEFEGRAGGLGEVVLRRCSTGWSGPSAWRIIGWVAVAGRLQPGDGGDRCGGWRRAPSGRPGRSRGRGAERDRGQEPATRGRRARRLAGAASTTRYLARVRPGAGGGRGWPRWTSSGESRRWRTTSSRPFGDGVRRLVAAGRDDGPTRLAAGRRPRQVGARRGAGVRRPLRDRRAAGGALAASAALAPAPERARRRRGSPAGAASGRGGRRGSPRTQRPSRTSDAGDERGVAARRRFPGWPGSRGRSSCRGEPAYLLPEADLLQQEHARRRREARGERDTAAVLLQALAQFGVEARVIGMVVGPRVTRYELQLAPGTKVAKVSSLKDDLAYALATTEIRILAPIPGKSAVGVEVPNQRPDFVTLGDIYREFPKSAGPLMVWLGKDISGKAGLRRPHPAAAPAHRRHHRLGQERLRQLPRLVDPAAQHAGAGAHDHDRPQEGRAVALRPHPAPAGAGGHQHEGRRRRAAQRGQGDGRPLRAHGARARPQPGRDEQDPGPPGRAAAALHPDRHRRVGRPHDGLAARGGGLRHPAGAEVAGRRHPPGGGHPAARRPTSSPA